MLPYFLNHINKYINHFFLQVPITQKSTSIETRSKVQPETQANNESDKEMASKTEPRRVKIFDGGYDFKTINKLINSFYIVLQLEILFAWFLHVYFMCLYMFLMVLLQPHRYKSNEEYVYVRGRGRGKYICEECGIRCKKPSMLRKHIRTHSDVRPYHCVHCNFSFKTKG